MADTEQRRRRPGRVWPLSPYQIHCRLRQAAAPASRAAPAPIGSARSIRCAPIAPPDVAGRRFDFPPGYNLVTRPRAYEPVGFDELRGFADAYDLLRLVIETRKDQMERQRWRVRPRDPTFKRRSAAIDAEHVRAHRRA